MKLLSTLVAATAAHTLFDETMLTTVGPLPATCQVFSDNFDFYDLKKFDAVGRDMKAETSAAITGFSSTGTFNYKTCQPKYEQAGCASKGTAFWSENGSCKYTFVNAEWNSMKTSETSSGVGSDGFTLKWTSEEACGDGNFQFTLNAMCTTATDSKNGKFYTSSQTTCSA